MSMTDAEFNSVKTDIALIQKDIRQIEEVFKKVDEALSQMSDILKTIAVQENILANNERRLNAIEQQIIGHIKSSYTSAKEAKQLIDLTNKEAKTIIDRKDQDIIVSIHQLETNILYKLDKLDARVRTLENWRWYVIGITVVVVFITTKIPLLAIFG